MDQAFFHSHSCLRAVIDACLEGKAGEIQSVSENPTALRLDVGCYAVFGGNPETADALRLIEGTQPGRELVYSGLRWQQQILAVFPDAVDASMTTFVPGEDALKSARRRAADMHPEYRIRSLSIEDSLPNQLKPNGFQVHEHSTAFFRHGFGLVAVKGTSIVAQTTTYAVSHDKAEISISTEPEHRKKGLATNLAGAMLLECSRRGLEPHWSASNPVSKRLARRVGFVDDDQCQVLIVKKPTRTVG